MTTSTSAQTVSGEYATVGTTSALLVAANANVNGMKIQNQGSGTVYLGLGVPAVVGSGTSIASGASAWVTYNGGINAIATVSGTVLVNCTSTLVIPANTNRTRLTLSNDSWCDVWLNLGAQAIADFRVAGNGLWLPPLGGRYVTQSYLGAIYAVTDLPVGSANICVAEETVP